MSTLKTKNQKMTLMRILKVRNQRMRAKVKKIVNRKRSIKYYLNFEYSNSDDEGENESSDQSDIVDKKTRGKQGKQEEKKLNKDKK